MDEFLNFFEQKAKYKPMHLEITYNKTTDWSIFVYRKGMASQYPDSDKNGLDAVMVDVSDCDMSLAFAKAHVAMKEWLIANERGY